MRKRIFDIIQIGNKEDIPSRAFDYGIVVVILANILAMFLETFTELSAAFDFFKIVEYVTTAIFGIEYVLRIVTADYLFPQSRPAIARLRFLISFDGVIDLLSILPVLPFFSFEGFVAFRILRVVRIFHLFRVNSQYDSFQVITAVLKDRMKQIGSSLVIILILMLASSLGIYGFEHDAQPEAFANAFSGMWWSVSAILTVGYGDIYPVTVGGRILAILIAFLGVGVVAIPTGIISAGFVEQVTRKQHEEEKLTDIREIGEIVIDKEDEYFGKTIHEVNKVYGLRILVVLREGMTLVATDNLVLAEGDIVVVQSNKFLPGK